MRARERPGSLPTSRAGGDCSSDCQEATSLASRATACSSSASRAAPGICALAACCVGSKRPPRGMETCSSSKQPHLAGELMLAGDPLFVGRGSQIENRVAAHGRSGKAGHQRQQRLPLESGKVGVHHRRRNGIEQGHGLFQYINYLSGPGCWLSLEYPRVSKLRYGTGR